MVAPFDWMVAPFLGAALRRCVLTVACVRACVRACVQVGSRNDLQDAAKATRLLSQETPIHKGGGTDPVWDHVLEFELRDEDTHL